MTVEAKDWMFGIDFADGPDRSAPPVPRRGPFVNVDLGGRNVEIEAQSIQTNVYGAGHAEEVTIKGMVVSESRGVRQGQAALVSRDDAVMMKNIGDNNPEPHLADLWKD